MVFFREFRYVNGKKKKDLNRYPIFVRDKRIKNVPNDDAKIQLIYVLYPILFLFLSSPPSSSSLSTVSAGFNNECTLLAMLLLRVCGAESPKCLDPGNFPPTDQLLSALAVEVVVSPLVGNGGVVRLDPEEKLNVD